MPIRTPPIRRHRVATLLALLGLGLGGCAAPDAPGTLRVTVPYYSAATGPYFERAAQAFERTHPGTDVRIEVVNWDNLIQKLQTDVAGKANGDLAIVATRWLPDFVQDGLLEPLAPRMDAAFRDRFIASFLTPGAIQGDIYALPIAGSARALYYNQDLLAQAGFPDGPQTWDDVVAASRRIKAAGAYGFGLQGKEIETDVYWYYALWTHGGEVIGSDGRAAFASKAGEQALSVYKHMVDTGLTQPGVTSYSREDVYNLFKQGRLGMVIALPTLSQQIRTEAPQLRYGIAALPKATTAATFATTDSIVLFKNSRRKDLAWQFLEHLFSKDQRVAFTRGENLLPTTKAEAADPAFADADTQAFVALLPSARFAPVVSGWEDTAKAVTNALQSVYLGQAQPQQALQQAAAEANEALSR